MPQRLPTDRPIDLPASALPCGGRGLRDGGVKSPDAARESRSPHRQAWLQHDCSVGYRFTRRTRGHGEKAFADESPFGLRQWGPCIRMDLVRRAPASFRRSLRARRGGWELNQQRVAGSVWVPKPGFVWGGALVAWAARRTHEYCVRLVACLETKVSTWQAGEAQRLPATITVRTAMSRSMLPQWVSLYRECCSEGHACRW